MSEDERSSFEAILGRRAQDEAPVKILSIHKNENVIAKGENYGSNIESWKVRVTLGSGNQKVLSYIVKKQHETEHTSKRSRDTTVFMKEITMYRDILPKMEQLLESIDDTSEIPWGQYVGAKLYSQLYLEDLKVQGYRVMDRQKQLGFDSAMLVVRQLGKFHALSRILLTRGELPDSLFANPVWHNDKERVEGMINENVNRLVVDMKKWGDEWVEVSNRFKNMTPDFATSYFNCVSYEPNEFTVLCHGDCWTSNMLFRCGQDLERPFGVKFIDFQLPFVSSPARDLIFFFTSSVRLDVRLHHIDSLLEAYCDSLSSYLTKLNYEGEIPSKEDLDEMIRKRVILELGDTFMIVPVILCDAQNVPDFKKMEKEEMEANLKGDKSPKSWNVLDIVEDSIENLIKLALKKAMSYDKF